MMWVPPQRGSKLVWFLFEILHGTRRGDQYIRELTPFSGDAINGFVIGEHSSGRELKFLVGHPV